MKKKFNEKKFVTLYLKSKIIIATLFTVISLSVVGQKIAGKKLASPEPSSIDIKSIEQMENSGVQFLENNKKKVENENSSGVKFNLVVPKDAKGKTFKDTSRKPANSISNPSVNSSISNSDDDSKPTYNVNFEAVLDNNQSIPPDCGGAVGRDYIMTTLNSQIKIQNKKGDSLLLVSLNGFFSSVTNLNHVNDVFDPKILYDFAQDRWVLTACAHSNSESSSLLIAVSDSSNPLSGWKGFAYSVDENHKRWIDYPSVGINKNWIVVTGNIFEIGNPDSGPFVNSQIYVFNKKDLYEGKSNVELFDRPSTDGFTICPAATLDPNMNNEYLVSVLNTDYEGKGYLRLHIITGEANNPFYELTELTPNVPLNWNSSPHKKNGDYSPDFSPQSTIPKLIQNNDTRIQNVVFQNGSLWVTHTAFIPIGNPKNALIQWWQINPVNADVLQFGRIRDDTGKEFYAFPSIAVNKNNDVLIGYSSFSSSQFGSANFSFRAKSDPLNSMQPSIKIKKGLNKYYKMYRGTHNRWGDYTTTCLDPDQVSLWTLQEYAEMPGEKYDEWGTFWTCVKPK